MLAFVTTLRHPQNSVDYGRVEKLLLETLNSVAQQTSDDHVIIIVGNKLPDFPLPERAHFVPVDFPPPAPPTGAKTARAPFVWDKGTKLGIGMIAARDFSPTHVMIFDADDFVHRELAEIVHDNPEHEGWVIREGLMYSRARNSYVPQTDFNRACGTSFIVPFEAYGVPAELSLASTQEQIAAAYGERLSAIMGAHRDAEAWYAEHGRTLKTFPFPAAVYHVDTGENHSGKSLVGFARPFDKRLGRDFGIQPSLGRVATLWAAYGAAAVADEVKRFAKRVSRLAARVAPGSAQAGR